MSDKWSGWVEQQRQVGKIHVDNPGEIKWFSGYGPAESGQCRCGRRAVVSERAGRITALGALANSIEAGDL